ncbi:MAG: hypothetical protein LBO73_03980 [Holosporaceae bacterium]|jgi:RNA polymerase sigma-54 factor|nr:hypothetical protein [Holosporaceae bacterium]
MKESVNQFLLVGQRQILSQSLRYSLKILTMNNLELQEHISEKFADNPFLRETRFYDCGCDETEKLKSKHTVREEIFMEASFLRMDDFEKEIAEEIIGNADCKGYLNGELLQHVSREKGVHYSKLLEIIRKLKRTSFASMFSFNLGDKLKTFVENEKADSQNYKKLAENSDLVFSGNWEVLKSKCGFKDGDLQEMISGLRGALSFDCNCDGINVYRTVDLTAEERFPEEFKVSAENAVGAEFDSELYDRSLKSCRSPADKTYIKDNAAEAKLLIRAINSRNSTLLKVANEIIYRQKDFFSGKDRCFIPVSAESVARSLFLHESTVDRAVSNKTISTPRGIFELKEMLPRRIESLGGEVSVHSLKEYIKRLIKNEPRESPYSDDNIVNSFNARGIEVSRRTVSKYRSLLGIPNSHERIKIYKMAARA